MGIFLLVLFVFNFCSAGNDGLNTLDALKTLMDYSIERQLTLSQNMASKNLKNYRSKDLKRPNLQKLKRYKSRSKFNMRVTSPNHLAGRLVNKSKFETFEPRVTEVNLNGNDVEIDDQLLRQSKSSSELNTITKAYSKLAGMMKSAISR